MAKEKEEIIFSDPEKVELLKDNLINLMSSFELPINVVYFVYKDCFDQLKNTYAQYQQNLYKSIREKQNKMNTEDYLEKVQKQNSELEAETFSIND